MGPGKLSARQKISDGTSFWPKLSDRNEVVNARNSLFYYWKNESFHDLSIMGALTSLCKALEHLRMAFWSLYRWNATFCYIILSEARAHRVDFGAK